MKEIRSEKGGQNSSAMAYIQSSGGGGCNTSVSDINIARSSGNIPRENRSYFYQEFLKRKEKGLCFRCGQNYSPMHKCPSKSLRVTILAEDEGIPTDINPSVEEEQREWAEEHVKRQFQPF